MQGKDVSSTSANCRNLRVIKKNVKHIFFRRREIWFCFCGKI